MVGATPGLTFGIEMSAQPVSSAPLRGLKVLDLSRMVPGAFCTLLLADLGADVVKVEAPVVGDGLRRMGGGAVADASHLALNRGKRSTVVDLRRPEAHGVLKRLAAWSDVVVESQRPGQLDERNLGYRAMSTDHAELVWCSITGFGGHGPKAELAGHDLTYLGYSGLLARLSDWTEAPTPPGVTVSLPLAASMAAVGILAAVADARLSGRGRKVDVNMTDTASWILSEEIARMANSPGPSWGTSPDRNVYACADGRRITVAADSPTAWLSLCEALGVADPAKASEELVAERFLTKPASHWLTHPGPAAGIGPVNEAADVIDDPHTSARKSVAAIRGSNLRVLANPIRYDGATGEEASQALQPPPQLGGHTDEVLAVAGFSESEIADLRAAQVVA